MEVQVVSALGLAWAEAEHEVRYKFYAHDPRTEEEERLLARLLDTLSGSVSSGEQSGLDDALANLAQVKYDRLNWRTSTVDLLKLLGLDSGAGARERLAERLHVHVGPTGSPEQHTALYKAVMKELAVGEEKWINKVESHRRNDRCLNCGSEMHWEYRCSGSCGKCMTTASIYDILVLLILTKLGLYPRHTASKCRFLVRCIECEFSLCRCSVSLTYLLRGRKHGHIAEDCPDRSRMRSMANLASMNRDKGPWAEAEEVGMVNIHSEDEDGQTPLLCTTENGYEAMISPKRANASVSNTTSTRHSAISWTDQGSSTNPTSVSQSASGPEQDVGGGRSSMTFYRYSVEAEDKSEELESITSNNDDIQSQADSTVAGLAGYRKVAVNYFVKTFTKDVELFALYQAATCSIRKDKFVRNHRRLLKQLFLDVKSDEMTPSQKLALRFLKSRSRRIHISSEIYRAFVVSDTSIRDKIDLMINDEKDKLSLLNRYLEGLDAAEKPDGSVTVAGNGKVRTLC